MRQTNPPIEVRFESLTLDDLDAVMRIERLAYAYPWSRAVFEDTVVAGYQAQRLLAGTTLLGYFVAMKGVEEVQWRVGNDRQPDSAWMRLFWEVSLAPCLFKSMP